MFRKYKMTKKNTTKRLQKKSNYAQYDMDNDGVVSDEELEHMKQIKQTENEAG